MPAVYDAAGMLSWLGIGSVRASAGDRARASSLEPVETLETFEDAITFVTRGNQTRGALPVATQELDAALYSSRGRGYAPYNEDGAVLFRDERGRLYLAVFDQAGGLGGKVRGAGSGIAAERLAKGFRALAGAPDSIEACRRALVGAMEDTHQVLIARGEGEVTTGVAAVVSGDGRAGLATSGDSAAIRFDAQGRFVEMTPLHEGEGPFGAGCLTHAMGLYPEGPDVRFFDWVLEEGGLLVLCTDGLLDSGLDRDEVGTLLVDAPSLEEGVNELARRILRRMSMYRAKPDNLTMVALRRKRDGSRQTGTQPEEARS